MTPNYDTKEGIASFLTDLASINRLQKLRREAGYDRNEHMGEWVVLGRWRLSCNGNFDPIVERYDGKIPATMGKCPPVMTLDETYLFLRGESLTSSSAWAFPPAYAVCKTCGKGWMLEDCHDFMTSSGTEDIPLDEWVGQPLASLKKIPSLVDKVVHHISYDSVYSDVYEGESRSGTSGKPWHRVEKDYIIQPGDRAMVHTTEFEHKGCYQQEATREVRDAFAEAFAKAGYPKVNFVTRKNEYCPCDSCAPWFTAQVNNETPIKIGWRKSVINLDWSETGKKLDIFEGEPVTVGSTYIHAHGYAKLAEYLGKLMPALGVRRVA